jgi:DNA-binding Lrp family transcriptional regulator
MDEIDLRLLAAVQDGFPVVPRPFREMGVALGMGEEEVMERLSGLQSQGLVRRIGPILDLRRLGRAGMLAAMQVPAEEADEASKVVNEYPEVSHNYLRPNVSGYNLWFTISASEERIEEILREIESRSGKRLLLLPTERIFKIGVKFDII